MYITFEEYGQIYDPIDKNVFNRLVYDACRLMDVHTTGIDNVKKLRRFFPTEEYDVMAVKRCAADLIHLQYQILQAEAAALESGGYESTEMGMRGKVISSVTAGNESISYATGNGSETSVDAAVKDKTVRKKLLSDIIWESLSGVADANGVNLMFMGRYPNVYRYHNAL